MVDAFLCRYGNQDIHQLRGVDRLTEDEKIILSSCIAQHIENEVSDRPDKPTPQDTEE